MEVGGEGDYIYIYISLHCHHQNDFCIKMGSEESHFNVSVGSDGQSHRTVPTNHSLSEEKGEPKRYRTEVLPLTSLTSYQHSKPERLLTGRSDLRGHESVRAPGSQVPQGRH